MCVCMCVRTCVGGCACARARVCVCVRVRANYRECVSGIGIDSVSFSLCRKKTNARKDDLVASETLMAIKTSNRDNEFPSECEDDMEIWRSQGRIHQGF